MRIRKGLVSGLILGAAMVAGQAWAQSAPQLDLALCLDGSGSISGADFQLQLDGTANAVADPAIVPQNGTVRLTVIQFGSAVSVEVPPTIITSANASTVAATIRTIAQDGLSTNMGGCINEATNQVINVATPASVRQVVDLSTDGVPTTGPDTATAAQAAQAAGVDALNAIGVGSGIDVPFLESIVFPQPPGGDDGFVVVVNDFSEYEAAIERKIQGETGGGGIPPIYPEPAPAIGAWGLGLSLGLLALVGGGLRRRSLGERA